MDWDDEYREEALPEYPNSVVCGPLCWNSNPDTKNMCRCVCGQEQHGLLRDPERSHIVPRRLTRINRRIYEMTEIGIYDDMVDRAIERLRSYGWWRITTFGYKNYHYPWDLESPNAPVRINIPLKEEWRRWPELTEWVDVPGRVAVLWERTQPPPILYCQGYCIECQQLKNLNMKK